jgi:hypothetical protein
MARDGDSDGGRLFSIRRKSPAAAAPAVESKDRGSPEVLGGAGAQHLDAPAADAYESPAIFKAVDLGGTDRRKLVIAALAAGAAAGCERSKIEIFTNKVGKCTCHVVCTCDTDTPDNDATWERTTTGSVCTCDIVCTCNTVCTCNSQGSSGSGSGSSYWY